MQYKTPDNYIHKTPIKWLKDSSDKPIAESMIPNSSWAKDKAFCSMQTYQYKSRSSAPCDWEYRALCEISQ